MKSIYVREEHEILRAQVRRFVNEVVRPQGERWEAEGRVPREVIARMGALGLLGIRHPEAYGGTNDDALASAIFAEELGRSTFGGFSATVLVHTDMASPHLRNAGSKAQLERWMPGIVRGDVLTAIAVSEPGAGSDVAGLRATARHEGDGWILNGTKTFITNGLSADLLIVAARTDASQKGSRGISMFLVERDTPGLSVGRKLEKLGWRCSDTAELCFEDARLPGDALLGKQNRGFYEIMKNFQNERLVLAALAVGESTEALGRTIEHAKSRKAFGSTLWDKQAIRQRIAMLGARLEATRQLLYHAAWLLSQGADAVREISMLKAVAGELVNEVMYACQQFHGGMGYIQETVIARMARDARVLAVGGGATEVMLEEVAKRL